MVALKLFISHSSRLDDESVDSSDPEKNSNLKLLLEVIEDIKLEYGESIDILVDKDEYKLPPGHDWEKRLNEWLAECHAAIILFFQKSCRKLQLVKKEATILSWRRELDKEFILIPVCIQGQQHLKILKEIFSLLCVSINPNVSVMPLIVRISLPA